MRTTTLPGLDVPTSVLGLGTVDLFRLPHRKDRLQVLAAAHDSGVAHFDTAPMYGLGLAEHELGLFALGRRDRMVIATKFGIAPTMLCRGLARVQGPIRRLFAAAPGLRNRVRAGAAGSGAGPAGSLLYSAPGYTPEAARRGLYASLRALGTDYLDLFLLHEPRPGDVRSVDVCAYLERARDAGLIRAWGVAGERGPSARVAAELPAAGVLQVREDVLLRLAASPALDGARITFGTLGRSLPQLLDLAPPGHDSDRRQALAELLLRDAFRANPDGVVLLGTANLAHLATAVRAANRDPRLPDPAVDALVDQVRATTSPRVLTDPTTGPTTSPR